MTNQPNTEDGNELDNLIEKLADIEHQRWADWQRYCNQILRARATDERTLEERLQYWDKQINTPYAMLSEREKESDREQVRRYLPIIQSNYILKSDVEKIKREWFDDAYNTTKIMGKSVDEICTILCGLDVERITDIKMTMGNLDKLSKIVTADLRESYQKAISKTFEDFRQLAKKESSK
jgi:hypothetical protein